MFSVFCNAIRQTHRRPQTRALGYRPPTGSGTPGATINRVRKKPTRDFQGHVMASAGRWSHWDQYTRTGFATLKHTFDKGWGAKAQFNHQINGYNANLGAAASGFPDQPADTGVSKWAGQYIACTTSNAGHDVPLLSAPSPHRPCRARRWEEALCARPAAPIAIVLVASHALSA